MASQFPDIDDMDNETAHTELKSLRIASCVAHPIGCFSCFFIILSALAGCGVFVYSFPVCLSFNFTDFKVINSEIANQHYQLILSEENRYSQLGTDDDEARRRLQSEESAKRRLEETTMYGYTLFTWDDWYYRARASTYLNVFFYSKKTDNILTKELLAICHDIEQQIKAFAGYSDHSLISKANNEIKQLFGGIDPLYLEAAPGSFLNYVYPQVIEGLNVFNGNGDTLSLVGDDIESTIRTYKDITDLTQFFDFSFDFIDVKSKYLASVYPFGLKNQAETKDELYDWTASYKTDFFDKLQNDKVGFAVSDYRGRILEDELYFYLAEDLNLAIFSLVAIFVIVYLYCRSLYIAFFGLLGVCAGFVPCFALYRLVWGEQFNLVNMVSVWVILGIGCDDICVFMSSYRRAPLESIDGQIIPNHLRLAFAFREAGSAMFVTSFTTSCSFFSLCLSTINPLPQFGFFLGSLVLVNFALVMSYFPCILQSYVWMVMLFMKCGCHVNACSRWLAVAVPLPSKYDHRKEFSLSSIKRQSSAKVLKASKRSLGLSPISQNDFDRNMPIYARQSSENFVVPGAASPGTPGGMITPSARFVRQLTRKLDKNKGDVDGGSLAAETQFSACTNLYFVVMRRGLGLTLMALVLVSTIIFAYTATLITLPEETAVLLPEDTNWGAVNEAIKNMDVDEENFNGYTSGGESTGDLVAVDTQRPTPSPTAPTTLSPSNTPTVPTDMPSARPTLSPTSPQPTNAPTLPTTAMPTTSFPTNDPTQSLPTASPSTANPTSSSPTQSPITDAPTLSPNTMNPTLSPSAIPSTSPTESTTSPTSFPTSASPTTTFPTDSPLTPADPTRSPSYPTNNPTKSPSTNPSAPPSNMPTTPTNVPTISPSDNPSTIPTKSPSSLPTKQPSKNPTGSPSFVPSVTPTALTFAPSSNPSASPSTANPTKYPTNDPSTVPTSSPTAAPTDQPTPIPTVDPTAPTKEPTLIPTSSPTKMPTFAIPVGSEYECINENTIDQVIRTGDKLSCTLESLVDETGQGTQLLTSHIAFVLEGGGLNSDDTQTTITGCSAFNNDSSFWNPNVYNESQNGFDVKWCFDSSVKDESLSGVSSLRFEILAPFKQPTISWFRLSLWLFFNNEWNLIFNDIGSEWYNYTIVSGYQAATQVLDVDESVPITLLFGTQSVSEYTTDCDGEVTSGELTLSSDFDIYDYAAQQRLVDLCNALEKITDVIMYRRDDDQEACFGHYFERYLNKSRGLELPLSNRTEFNRHIREFVSTGSFEGMNPRDFNGLFGTETKAAWNDSSSEIRWFRIVVQTQIDKKWGGSTMYEYYKKWDDFMADFNANSPPTFQGFQTTGNYIRMEVENEFLNGFVQSLFYTIVLCALVMVFFTQNLFLVLLVCMYILIICIWVVGLFGALGWPFGIIEIISVPTVIGLTIDYALHITHAYIHSPFPDRQRRAKSAVNDLGSSVFASAMTTISAMTILYFATIVIFSDLGWVVGSTTAFGVALALFVCPPCLYYTGPQYDQCHFAWFCPHSMNGVKCGHHRFCANEWRRKRGIAKEHKKAIELQVQQQNDRFEKQEEGTNAGAEQDDGDFDIDLPTGWKAVLTDDGKVYYQNDTTKKTQWHRPDNDDDVIHVAPPMATSIQSEPDNVVNELDDLPPSRQQSENVAYNKEIEAESDKEESNQPYVVPNYDEKETMEAPHTPLVGANDAGDDNHKAQDAVQYIPPKTEYELEESISLANV